MPSHLISAGFLQTPPASRRCALRSVTRHLGVTRVTRGIERTDRITQRGPYARTQQMRRFLEREPYVPPSWASKLTTVEAVPHSWRILLKFTCVQVPEERIALGLLPTPIHRWRLPNVPSDLDVWIKRDDMSGNELSGNKVPAALYGMLLDGE